MSVASENHKLEITQKLDYLPDFAIDETLDFIDFLITKHQLKKTPNLWQGIERWRNKAEFDDNEVLTDELIASWRDKSNGRDFSWDD